MNDYRKLANDLLDYMSLCSDKHIAPLKWDLNHYTKRLHEIGRKETPRRKRID